MKAYVVYDSAYGNTRRISESIGGGIGSGVEVLQVGEATPSRVAAFDLLVVGSPTQGGRPTQPVRDFLAALPASTLKGTRVAAFDTRIPTRWVGIFGYAAGRIGNELTGKGATLMAAPEGFFVRGKEGPLKEGELERAADWGRRLAESEQKDIA